MKPVVDRLEADYEGRIAVERLDIDDPGTSEAKATYKFRFQPYFVLLDSTGNVVTTWTGDVEERRFHEEFASILE